MPNIFADIDSNLQMVVDPLTDPPQNLPNLDLRVELVEDDSLPGQGLQVGRHHGGVVPGDVGVAQVVCQDVEDVGPGGLGCHWRHSVLLAEGEES